MKRFSLIGKVLIGFLLIGGSLSTAIVFMYNAIHEVSSAVDHAGEPNARLEKWKATVNLLYEAENKTRNFRITKKRQEVIDFDSLREHTYSNLMDLYAMNQDSHEALVLTDTLEEICLERFENLSNWISFSDSISTGPSIVDDILQEMDRKEKSFLEKKRDTLISTSSTEAAAPQSESEREKWRIVNIFKRHKTPKPEETAPVQKDSVVAITDTIHVIETADLRKTIESGQLRQESMEMLRIREESQLLKADQQVMLRLHTVSDQFENLTGKESAEKLKAISEAAAGGTRTVVTWVVVIAVLLICFFIYFISRDVRRSRLFQMQLQTAKENAERLAKTREEFLANMSHEIRTPLNVISGFSSQLLKSGLEEKQKEYAEGVSRSSEYLIALVNDVLDYSKLKSGKLQLENKPFLLKDICRDLEAAFGTAAKEKGLRFSIEMDVNLGESIQGDPVRFRQVLYNLVSNALKFTSSGFIRIQMRQLSKPGAAFPWLEISIEDSGIGIDKKSIERIFDEFEQADSSITRKYGGTGLGLAITRAIVLQMEGTVNVESEPGKGSVFKIEIPCHNVAPGKKAGSDSAVYAKDFLSGKTVLICDDDVMNRMLAAHLVGGSGAKVLEAGSGKEALALLETEAPDLVLMDLHMPDVSGEETIQRIRQLKDQKQAATKIIAVTGRNRDKVMQGNPALAPDGYIQKPYKEAQLLSEIHRVLQA